MNDATLALTDEELVAAIRWVDTTITETNLRLADLRAELVDLRKEQVRRMFARQQERANAAAAAAR